MMENCLICERIALIKGNKNPYFFNRRELIVTMDIRI